MFSTFFTTVDPSATNFHPTVKPDPAAELYGELEPKDLEWTIGSGIVTETQVWYHSLEDGTFLMFQIIHSSVGMWYPTIQFTFKIWDPKSKEKTWKSVNVANFVTPPPASGTRTFDKRSSKCDQFSVIHNDVLTGEYAESYTVTANLGPELQLSIVVSRPSAISGFKLGAGPKGGFSYFGPDPEKPEGYVVHRFWPRTHCSGHLILNGQAREVKGTGMFIHAIQGMRPNLVAASWNFCDFQSEEHGGTSAVQMEFKTIDAYGKHGAGSGGVSVNVGSLVIGGKLVAVSGETTYPSPEDNTPASSTCRAEHLDPEVDPDTSYKQPSKIRYSWEGRSIIPSAAGTVSANLTVDLGSPSESNGLIEKVDVLAEIPYVIKAFVNYVAGTKPYIYQWLNPTTLNVTGPAGAFEGAGENPVQINGTLFNEATFIS